MFNSKYQCNKINVFIITMLNLLTWLLFITNKRYMHTLSDWSFTMYFIINSILLEFILFIKWHMFALYSKLLDLFIKFTNIMSTMLHRLLSCFNPIIDRLYMSILQYSKLSIMYIKYKLSTMQSSLFWIPM